jgi:hypothetical protein
MEELGRRILASVTLRRNVGVSLPGANTSAVAKPSGTSSARSVRYSIGIVATVPTSLRRSMEAASIPSTV